jgi:hypothetical protein
MYKHNMNISGRRSANENMDKLMGRLEKLSGAIGQLNPANSPTGSQDSGGLEMMADHLVPKQNGAPR